MVYGHRLQTQIDLFISRELKNWQKVISGKFLSDHWTIMAEIEWCRKLEKVIREKVDWDILKAELDIAREDEEKGNFNWYKGQERDTPYDKLKSLRQTYCSTMWITEKSQRW